MDLLGKDNYDFIIGHVPYLANGALNIKDLYLKRGHKPKIIFMIHDIPRTNSRDEDEDSLLEWLAEADFVFSIGKAVESEIISFIKSLTPEKRPIHKLYIPGFPLELFNVHRDTVHGNKVCGTQNITMMMGEQKDLDIRGVDFPLTVECTSVVSKHMLDFDGVKTTIVMLTDNEPDKEKWKKEFSELLQKKYFKGRSLYFHSETLETLEKLKAYLRKSNLFILPLKPDSPLFGTEALSAVAAGVPVLVSAHSGMAVLLGSLCHDLSVIKESALQPDTKTWKEGIIQKLVMPEEAQRDAKLLREQLLLDTSTAQAHLDFIRTIVGGFLVL